MLTSSPRHRLFLLLFYFDDCLLHALAIFLLRVRRKTDFGHGPHTEPPVEDMLDMIYVFFEEGERRYRGGAQRLKKDGGMVRVGGR